MKNKGLLIQIGGVAVIAIGTFLSKSLGLLIWVLFLIIGLWVIRIGGRIYRQAKR